MKYSDMMVEKVTAGGCKRYENFVMIPGERYWAVSDYLRDDGPVLVKLVGIVSDDVVHVKIDNPSDSEKFCKRYSLDGTNAYLHTEQLVPQKLAKIGDRVYEEYGDRSINYVIARFESGYLVVTPENDSSKEKEEIRSYRSLSTDSNDFADHEETHPVKVTTISAKTSTKKLVVKIKIRK